LEPMDERCQGMEDGHLRVRLHRVEEASPPWQRGHHPRGVGAQRAEIIHIGAEGLPAPGLELPDLFLDVLHDASPPSPLPAMAGKACRFAWSARKATPRSSPATKALTPRSHQKRTSSSARGMAQ